MIISSSHAMKSQDHSTQSKPKGTKCPFKPLPGHHKPPRGKYLAPSSKLAPKFRRKYGSMGRTLILMRGKRNPSVKSCVCSPASFPTERLFDKLFRLFAFTEFVEHKNDWNFGTPEFSCSVGRARLKVTAGVIVVGVRLYV